MTFEYRTPTSVEETLALLAQHGDEAKVLAGGTALNILMAQRLVQPAQLVSLQRVTELDGITEKDRVLVLGARATHRTIETSDPVVRHAPVLRETLGSVATIRIRNVATIGGNLAHGDPALDPPVTLIAHDARVRLRREGGERLVPVDEFFVDFYETVVQPDELIVSVEVPFQDEQTGMSFIKFRPRTVDDYATVSVATRLTGGPAGATCEDVRIAVGSASATPIRARQAEAALRDQPMTSTAFREAAAIARTEVDPIADARGSEGYKRDMVEVFVRRSLEQSLSAATGDD
jgi:carbon-monoxide dehydrogenase medium subunit